jgi:hypothetical protein
MASLLGGVFPETPGRVEGGLLEHVGGVEPALQTPVQPQPHHLFQPATAPLEQLGQRPTVPAAGALQQDLVIAPIAWQDKSPI